MLQTTTVASGSPQVTSASSTAFVQAGGVGAETLSLRGLGANRTLVLLNGRRAGPAGVRGEVSSFDFNVLPLSVIERVEILKDGASSIYGSDAVAGVVNVITRKDDGATADAFIGIPNESGGEESRFSFSWGKSLERGSFRVTADYHLEEELARGDRDYFKCGTAERIRCETGERADLIDPRTGKAHCDDLPWGHVWVYSYQYNYNADGSDGNVPGSFASGAIRLRRRPGQLHPGDHSPIRHSHGTCRCLPGWFLTSYDRQSDAIVQNSDHPIPGRAVAHSAKRAGDDLCRWRVRPDGQRLGLCRGPAESAQDESQWLSPVLGLQIRGGLRFRPLLPGTGGDPLSAGWTWRRFPEPTFHHEPCRQPHRS